MKHFVILFSIFITSCASIQTPFSSKTPERTSSIESKHSCCVVYTYIANINGTDTIDWSDEQYLLPGSNNIIVVSSLMAGLKAIQLVNINISPNTSYKAKADYSYTTGEAKLVIYEESTENIIVTKPMKKYRVYESQSREETEKIIQKILNK